MIYFIEEYILLDLKDVLFLNLSLSFIGIILIIFSISFLGLNDKLVKSLFSLTS